MASQISLYHIFYISNVFTITKNISLDYFQVLISGSPSSNTSHQNVPWTGCISFTSLRYATYFMYSKMEK